MSLADSIYEANSKSFQTSFLDELVEMALAVSVRDRTDETTIYQLHLEDNQIYYGHDKIDENRANVYRLTEYEEKISEPQLLLFWKRLRDKLPVLDRSVIQISKNIFWDKNNGEIIIKEDK